MVYLGKIEGPTLNFWYTVCVDIDNVEETISTAINGIVTSQDVELGEGVAEQTIAVRGMTEILAENEIAVKQMRGFGGVISFEVDGGLHGGKASR